MSLELVNLKRDVLVELDDEQLTALLAEMAAAEVDLLARTRERAIRGFRDGDFGTDLAGLNATLAELGLAPHELKRNFSTTLSISVHLSGPATPSDIQDPYTLGDRLGSVYAARHVQEHIHQVLVSATEKAGIQVTVSSDVRAIAGYPDILEAR